VKISEALIALLIAGILTIATVAAFIAYKDALPYGFVDDSTQGEIHQIDLDGQGGYEMRFLRSFPPHERVFLESGTYSDPGGDEITLTAENGHTYKIRVWGRNSKRPQYRLSLEKSPTQ
jgi:hypothetical protein